MAVGFEVVEAPEHGLAPGRVFELVDGEHLVGRTRDAAICLGPDPMAERRHANLRVAGEAVEVVDLGSTHGVSLGEDRVRRSEVPVWGELTFGSTRLRRVY